MAIKGKRLFHPQAHFNHEESQDTPINRVRYIGDGFWEVIRNGVKKVIRNQNDLTPEEDKAISVLVSKRPLGGTIENIWTDVRGN